MTNIILCPNCRGSQHVSKPPMIAGDVYGSYGSSGTETYPCPICDGKGWIDSDADSDVAAMKTIVLSAFETSENLMDECVKRGERIKELERQIYSLIDTNEVIREQRDRVTMNYRDKHDLELLDTLLKTLNPRIKPDVRPIMTPLELVSKDVNDVWRMCQDVIEFRREHNIVG